MYHSILFMNVVLDKQSDQFTLHPKLKPLSIQEEPSQQMHTPEAAIMDSFKKEFNGVSFSFDHQETVYHDSNNSYLADTYSISKREGSYQIFSEKPSNYSVSYNGVVFPMSVNDKLPLYDLQMDIAASLAKRGLAVPPRSMSIYFGQYPLKATDRLNLLSGSDNLTILSTMEVPQGASRNCVNYVLNNKNEKKELLEILRSCTYIEYRELNLFCRCFISFCIRLLR